MRVHQDLMLHLPKDVLEIVFNYIINDIRFQPKDDQIKSFVIAQTNPLFRRSDERYIKIMEVLDTFQTVCKHWKKVITNKSFVYGLFSSKPLDYENIEYTKDDRLHFGFIQMDGTISNNGCDWSEQSTGCEIPSKLVNPMYYSKKREGLLSIDQFEQNITEREHELEQFKFPHPLPPFDERVQIENDMHTLDGCRVDQEVVLDKTESDERFALFIINRENEMNCFKKDNPPEMPKELVPKEPIPAPPEETFNEIA